MTDKWEKLRKSLEDDIKGFGERRDQAKDRGLRNVTEAYRFQIRVLRDVLDTMTELDRLEATNHGH